MSKFKAIRDRLDLSQESVAQALGCTQGTIAHYEAERVVVPVPVAKALILFARPRRVRVTLEDVYGTADEPTPGSKRLSGAKP